MSSAAPVIPGVGLYPNLLREAYDAIARVNWSTLKWFAKSAFHYRHHVTNQPPDTDAKKLGRCIHIAALEPERFRSAIAIWEGGRRYGKEWEAFKRANIGREILKPEERDVVVEIAKAARADEYAAPLLRGGSAELTVLAELEGVETKCRLDFGQVGALVDIKSTRTAEPDAFERQCFNLGYPGQAAYYVDSYRAATGKLLPFFVIAVETDAPHVVQVYEVDKSALDYGRDQYRSYLLQLATCRRENRWPGYAAGPINLGLPRWVERQSDESIEGVGLDFTQQEA